MMGSFWLYGWLFFLTLPDRLSCPLFIYVVHFEFEFTFNLCTLTFIVSTPWERSETIKYNMGICFLYKNKYLQILYHVMTNHGKNYFFLTRIVTGIYSIDFTAK